MNKIDQLLDAIDHPENYSPEELAEILQDTETAEIYSMLCNQRAHDKNMSAIDSNRVDLEWRKFNSGLKRKPVWQSFFKWKSSAAVVVAFASCSLLAVGIVAGININKANKVRTIEPVEEKTIPSLEESKIVYTDTVSKLPGALIFEDEPLHDMLVKLAPAYGVKLNFKSDNAKNIQLYFKWDETISLEELVEQLNTFDRIRIQLNDNTLTVF